MTDKNATQSKLRNFVFTVNMKTRKVSKEEVIEWLSACDFQAFIFQLEQGENADTEHWQGYCELKKQMRFNAIAKLSPGAHIEPRRGSQEQAIDYCRKSETAKGELITLGEFKREAGVSASLQDFINAIKEGKDDLYLLDNFPKQFSHYRQLPTKIRQTLQQDKAKSIRNVEVEYWYGETATGKTTTAWELFPNHYRITNYGAGMWDGYDGQEVIVLDEFHGKLSVSEFLMYLDKFPVRLQARYSDRVATYTKVIIISNQKWNELYSEVQKLMPSSWNAMTRRIKTFRTFPLSEAERLGLQTFGTLFTVKDS